MSVLQLRLIHTEGLFTHHVAGGRKRPRPATHTDIAEFAATALAFQIVRVAELLEHQDRLATTAEREDQMKRIELIGATGELSLKRYNEDVEQLRGSWPDDPRLRPRTWTPWWSAHDMHE